MTCAYGVHIVGRVLIVFGICDAAASVGFGFIIKKIGRIPIFILGATINILVIIVMLSWSPARDQVAGYRKQLCWNQTSMFCVSSLRAGCSLGDCGCHLADPD